MMDADTLETPARDLKRLWEAERGAIVAALPPHIHVFGWPERWLDFTWARLQQAMRPGVDPASLLAAVRQMAADGLSPLDGALHVAEGRAVWVPRWQAMRRLLMACMPHLLVRADVVRPGDHFDVDRDAKRRVIYLNHQRQREAWSGDWDRVFAFASLEGGRRPCEPVLMLRATAEGLAAQHLQVPAGLDSAEDAALRVAVIKLAQRLPLERDWTPVRRFFAVANRIWSEPQA